MLKTRREAVNTIKRVVRKSGYTTYMATLGTRPIEGGRVRIERRDKAKLVEAIDEYYRTATVGGAIYAMLTKRQAIDAKVAFDLLANAQIDLPLSEVARRYAAGVSIANKPAVVRKPIGEAYDEYRVSDPSWSDIQRTTVGYRCGKFVEFFGRERMVSDMDAETVGKYLERFRSLTTRNNVLRYMRTFVRWCSEEPRNWCDRDQLRGLRVLPVAYAEPKFMKPEGVEAVLRAAEEAGDRKLLALMCLGFFMGIRFAEIRRLAAGEGVVSPEDRSVRIGMPKGWTRGVVPRVVPMLGKVSDWFRTWRLGEALRGMDARKAREREVALAEGDNIKVPHNAARHTFITMFMAMYNDVGRATTICGTGKTYVARSYMGLASRKEARRFFAIAPNRERAREFFDERK